MNIKRKNLTEELESIVIHKEIIGAMNELMYTAYETGIIDIKFHDNPADDFITIIKIVKLAEKYQTGVPNKLRM